MTLTVGELRDLVAMVNLAAEALPEDQVPEVVAEVSRLYFELMEGIQEGILDGFGPG
jgi:hypothetical protein